MNKVRMTQLVVGIRWACLLSYLFMTFTAGGAVVLCKGHDGHMAIELASVHCSVSISHASNNIISIKNTSSPCKDTLLSVDSPVSVQSRSETSRPLVLTEPSISTTVLEPIVSTYWHTCITLPKVRSITSLRSVILLI